MYYADCDDRSLMCSRAAPRNRVVQEDVARAPQAEKAVQAPEEDQAVREDTGELAKLGKTVPEEAPPPKSGKAERWVISWFHTRRGYVFYDVHFDFDK